MPEAEMPVMSNPFNPGEPMQQPVMTDVMTNPFNPGEPMTEAEMPDVMTNESPSCLAGEPMTEGESMADTQRMLHPEDAARAVLNGLACELGHDEVRVLTRVAERLKGGMTAYGPLDLASDNRQFRSKEAREEVEDALVYLACAWLKTEEVSR